jgi:cytochrome P450
MGRIAQDTIKVLSTYNPDEKVEILKWCTNLTFETIGIIGFGYSFGVLDRNHPSHPFLEAMDYALREDIRRFSRPEFVKWLPLEINRRWENGNNLMRSIVEEVIQDRKSGEHAKDMEKDLLGFMLNARDEQNLGLSDENIRDQVITFLIAGHDTTANTLAYALYEISRHPGIEARVLQEIANAGITSEKFPTVEQISSLKYISGVLKETLRLHSPLQAISKYCRKDCVLPGGYRVEAGSEMLLSITNMHRNEDAYPDPHRFDPDRWTPEEEQKRSRFAWLPFSTNLRGCLGAQVMCSYKAPFFFLLFNQYIFDNVNSLPCKKPKLFLVCFSTSSSFAMVSPFRILDYLTTMYLHSDIRWSSCSI